MTTEPLRKHTTRDLEEAITRHQQLLQQEAGIQQELAAMAQRIAFLRGKIQALDELDQQA
jgi:uncharacterized protein YhbP (UPF0306 family)